MAKTKTYKRRGTSVSKRIRCAAWNTRARAVKAAVDRGWTERKEAMPDYIDL